ncbi:MAG: D-2-hydroxyacid dehydrogenase [Lachnospiraceae bacterium]|nr:D-2-hydroxyacid dehydrogenase [Lachnospiraceae bacterium]
MEKLKAVVLYPCDDAQRVMMEETAKDRCELLFVPPDMSCEERLPILEQADVIFGEPEISEILQCPKLRWVQMSWAGTDKYTRTEGFPRDRVQLTSAKGCYSVVIAEYILAVLLELCRNLKQYAENQGRQQWKKLGTTTLLYGKRALILGAGDIGTATAGRLRPFEVYVTGMRRTERNYPDCFDRMITLEELDQELPQEDIVIASLPGTAQTEGLLDGRRLRLMKEDALLVNVGRGSLIDTDALVKVLEEGHLGGVALDVVAPEPLPEDHPLWKFERVVITPHVAGQSFGLCKDTENRIIQLSCRNLERYLDGKKPENLVDFDTGYSSL